MTTPADEHSDAGARAAAPRLGRRLLVLALCVGAGMVVGVVGRHVGGTDAGFLAIPILVAVGWFALADPGACTPGQPRAGPSDPDPPNRSRP